MQQSSISKTLLIAIAITFFMLLTRGSHVLTNISLPDASIVLFLMGGLLLKRTAWFISFFILATVIDFGAAAFDPAQGFCLTNGYWGLIPAYGVMWLGGHWLAKQIDAFDIIKFSVVGLMTSFVAFVISTQTYYLFSGRFPEKGLIESMQHGWNYLPSWMGYAAFYLAIAWLAATLFKEVKILEANKV